MILSLLNFGISRRLGKGTVAALLINALMEGSTGLASDSQEVVLFNSDQVGKLFSEEALPHLNPDGQ